MYFVIKNLTDARLTLEGVNIDPGVQLRVSHLTPDMEAARDAGMLQVRSGDETLEERRADIKAIESFKP